MGNQGNRRVYTPKEVVVFAQAALELELGKNNFSPLYSGDIAWLYTSPPEKELVLKVLGDKKIAVIYPALHNRLGNSKEINNLENFLTQNAGFSVEKFTQ